MPTKSVILIGATGLIGQACFKGLAASPRYTQIKIFTRRPLPFPVDAARVQVHVVDFTRLNEYAADIQADQLICTLGTTLKKAGSRQNFYQVDFTFPYQFAKLAFENGAQHFLLVTSNGANPQARLFYPRVKGELEVAVQKLGYRSLSIFRPSLLLGKRAEYRWQEEMAGRLAAILAPLIPARYRPIPARMVAGAMVQIATADEMGTRIYESDQIRQIYEKN